MKKIVFAAMIAVPTPVMAYDVDCVQSPHLKGFSIEESQRLCAQLDAVKQRAGREFHARQRENYDSMRYQILRKNPNVNPNSIDVSAKQRNISEGQAADLLILYSQVNQK